MGLCRNCKPAVGLLKQAAEKSPTAAVLQVGKLWGLLTCTHTHIHIYIYIYTQTLRVQTHM